MKVLMINVCCGVRSTGRICTDLATALEKQGHDVKIAYGRDTVPDKYLKYAVRIGTDFDVKMHGLRSRVLDGCGWGSKKYTVRFIKWVKDYNPDVIHLHNMHGYYINVEVLFNYLRTCRKRIIWTLHDCWAFTGHSAYCDVANCERWVTGCHDCPNMRIYPATFVDRSSRNWEKKHKLLTGIPNLLIVTPSDWLMSMVSRSFLSEYPTKVIHNGIDTKQFYVMENSVKNNLGIGDKKMILGVSTSWDDMKGFNDYLRLAEMLGDKYQVVLVGVSSIQKERLPDNVIGIERTNSTKELAQLYSAADLFLNLSYCENYPTVNLEARACGTPIITYSTGGSPESAGEDAVVVERGDLQAVEKAIRSHTYTTSMVDKAELDKNYTMEMYLKVYE